MKKKFEDNVAGSIPRAKTEEPSLPWKVEEEDLAGIQAREGEYEALSRQEAPLRTRPAFLVTLVIAIFLAALYMVLVTAVENESIKLGISVKEKEAAELQVDLDRIKTEKAAIEKNSEQLEKRVDDLRAQKELFTAVLESLTKKGDTAAPAEESVKEPVNQPAQEVTSVSGETATEVQ
jgi:hypothetical protein